MPSAGPEPLVARFQDDVARLTGAAAFSSARFGVAVSGGPDSMALLWLASRAFPGRAYAATVDHGLRAESAAEADMVAGWCTAEGVPHAVLRPSEPITGSIQSAARAVRYRLLDAWRKEQGIDWLLTAHHADDQLETILMRLNRASGVGGLAGIRARNGAVLRPLLGWRRAGLMEIVTRHALPHVRDPSNENTQFDRAAMRARLADVDWLDPIAFARSAAACAEAEAALQWTVERIAAEHVDGGAGGPVTLCRTDVPQEVLRRLVMLMIARAEPGATPPRGETIDQAIVQTLRGKRASIGKWLLTGGERWTVSLAPPRRVS